MASANDLRFVKYMSHWLVSLGCISVSSKIIPPAREQKFFTSAFIMEVGGSWFLVTAGHVLLRIKTYVKSWRDMAHQFVIYASFGTYTIKTGLLDFEFREPVFCVERSSGLDFGAIRLTLEEQKRLRQIGVFAAEERYWDQTLPERFQDFAMLGLPLNHMELQRFGEAGLQPVYLRVEPTQDLPEEYAMQTDPMRYYRIMDQTNPDLDIAAMSGCPIFAFHMPKDAENGEALIIGMQSSWFSNRRLIATCDLRFCGQLLREAIA